MRAKDKGVHGPAACVGAAQIAQAQHEARPFDVVLTPGGETKCRIELAQTTKNKQNTVVVS